MKILVLSDIHGNLEALNSLLRKEKNIDKLWILGDSTGYGPDSEKVVKKLLTFSPVILGGNHDRLLAGLEKNKKIPKKAIEILSKIKISEQTRKTMANWPVIHREESCTLVHGAPSDPVWNYIHTPEDGEKEFALFQSKICFFGHTHLPRIYKELEGKVSVTIPQIKEEYSLKEGRFLINPGSLGQPRDGDPRSSYLVYDAQNQNLRFGRSSYNVKRTQRKMKKQGFSEYGIERIALGD